jgi:predicted MFS family arabinose efflux permease
MALVLDLTGSATAVGGILVLRLLPAGFAGPIAAGVGGVAGWAWLQRRRGPKLATIRLATVAMGVILAVMSLLSTVKLAYVAAVPFGAAGASALVASITYLQETLAGQQRLLGLTVYHIVFRLGMSVAAIGGGLAAQLFGPTRLPLLGTVEPSALVLLCAGVVMVLGAALMPTEIEEVSRGGERRQARPHDRAEAGGEVLEQRNGHEAAR